MTLRTLEQFIAAIALVNLAMRENIGPYGVTVGYAIAIALIPVWVGVLRQYYGARAVVGCGLAALVCGILLRSGAAADHHVTRGITIIQIMLLFGSVCGIGVVLWARTMMSTRWVGIWFGSGLGLDTLVRHNAVFTTNPWKYGWAVATAVIVLAALSGRGRKGLEFTALIVLALLSIVFSSRSYLGTFAIAAVLMAWQMRPRRSSKQASWAWTTVFLGGLAVVIYQLGSLLLVDGYLGVAAQQRSVDQLNSAGSLILGGRPELAATIALMQHRPMGFGVGVVANGNDVLVAKEAMAAINYDPNNGYVDQFMFGNAIELHSTIGDMWASYGPAGVLLVLVLLYLIIRRLSESVAGRTASALFLFLGTWTLWNVFFSPFYSAAPTLILAVGVGLAARTHKIGHEAPADTERARPEPELAGAVLTTATGRAR
jgi:hypothetical protein